MGDDDERVTRLMEFLTKKLDERAAAFTAVRADNLSSYPAARQPRRAARPGAARWFREFPHGI